VVSEHDQDNGRPRIGISGSEPTAGHHALIAQPHTETDGPTRRPRLPGHRRVLRGRGQDDVDRVDRQLGCGPLGGAGDAGADVAAIGVDVAGDQREESLRISIALHQRVVLAQLGVQTRQVGDNAIVGEQSAALLERVGVLWA
jgi:hypothetical protein